MMQAVYLWYRLYILSGVILYILTEADPIAFHAIRGHLWTDLQNVFDAKIDTLDTLQL